jgi:hypothetical protein
MRKGISKQFHTNNTVITISNATKAGSSSELKELAFLDNADEIGSTTLTVSRVG